MIVYFDSSIYQKPIQKLKYSEIELVDGGRLRFEGRRVLQWQVGAGRAAG